MALPIFEEFLYPFLLATSWQRGLVQNPAFNKFFRKLNEK